MAFAEDRDVTTDTEREAQIRQTDYGKDVLLYRAVVRDIQCLCRLLDEARAEIVRGENTMRQQADKIMEQQREIARLTGQLQAYFDESPTYREVRDALRAEGYCMACGWYHRVGECEAVENARRETGLEISRLNKLLDAADDASLERATLAEREATERERERVHRLLLLLDPRSDRFGDVPYDLPTLRTLLIQHVLNGYEP